MELQVNLTMSEDHLQGINPVIMLPIVFHSHMEVSYMIRPGHTSPGGCMR